MFYLCLPDILAKSADMLRTFSSGVGDLCLLGLSWLLQASTSALTALTPSCIPSGDSAPALLMLWLLFS